jgi:acyl-CoA reductase-like NAD-dependent aldehyde dehydrogenase
MYVVANDDEAVARANSSAYGLNSTIHTKNLSRALKMASEMDYGQVHVNTSTLFVNPFATQGGCKGSGWGRQNSKWGLEEFLEEKFVSWREPGLASSGQFH